MSIILAFLSFILIATFPGWHYEQDELTGEELDVKPFPPRPVVEVCLMIEVVAAMLTLVMSLWQHTGAVAARAVVIAATYGNVVAEIGTAAVTLTWLSC